MDASAGSRGRRIEALVFAALILLVSAAALGPSRDAAVDIWRPEAVSTWFADLFRAGPVEGAPAWAAGSKRLLDGDPERGAALAGLYGCGACHRAPGIGMARGRVGPDLTGFSRRSYIAGVLSNRPGNLVSWLRDPPAHAPRTAMPDMGIGERDARDLAAWLYTLDAS